MMFISICSVGRNEDQNVRQHHQRPSLLVFELFRARPLLPHPSKIYNLSIVRREKDDVTNDSLKRSLKKSLVSVVGENVQGPSYPDLQVEGSSEKSDNNIAEGTCRSR